MEAHVQRALALFNHHRYAQAAEESRAQIAENPNDPRPYTVLALSNAHLGKSGAAIDAAQRAITLAPDEPFTHFCLAQVHLHFGRLKIALAAADEAVRLDPSEADYHALVGQLEFALERPTEAVAATDVALALDPRHVDALIHRAMALTFLGRNEDARKTAAEALALAPENDQAHVAAGRAMLHVGDSDGAIVHFREALRLDPHSEPARWSFVQALKARHRVYRMMLIFFLWMERQSVAVRIGVVIALIVGRNALSLLAREFPAVAPLAVPLAISLGLFLLLTWLADPLFNFLLRFDPVARHALPPRHRARSNYLLAMVGFLATLGIAGAAGIRGSALTWIMLVTLFLLPLSQLLSYPAGPQRRGVAIYCAAIAGLGATALALYSLSLDVAAVELAIPFLTVIYGIGCVASVSVGPLVDSAERSR